MCLFQLPQSELGLLYTHLPPPPTLHSSKATGWKLPHPTPLCLQWQ